MSLNTAAVAVVESLKTQAEALRIIPHTIAEARVLDFGITARGGLSAGLGLARVCLSDRAEVSLTEGPFGVSVQVRSDDPVTACMASQYAGWQVSVDKFFAMGSGPMRAALGSEKIFEHIPGKETTPRAVGCLETKKLPSEEVIAHLSQKLKIEPKNLSLLCAPAASMAGSVQVVARSLETALHKLHELGFDLKSVLSGAGIAPLPPIAASEIIAIGRTNDAILYGARVNLWVACTDDQIEKIGPQVPSSASKDHGSPFAEIFQRYNQNFYAIDPHLFSPAVIEFNNLTSGRRFVYGTMQAEVLRTSFGA